jgi:hypothetical protein
VPFRHGQRSDKGRTQTEIGNPKRKKAATRPSLFYAKTENLLRV